MTWYKTGTVAVTNNSKTVTGTGTSWVDSNIRPGFVFVDSNGVVYEVESITSATSITIHPAYKGTTGTGRAYGIFQNHGGLAELSRNVTDLIGRFSGYADEVETIRDEVVGTTVVTINTRTANYTLTAADAKGYVRMNLANPNTMTIPADATVNFAVGSIIQVAQVNEGQTTLVPASGVTLNHPETLKLRAKGSAVSLIKVAANEWDVVGDMEWAE